MKKTAALFAVALALLGQANLHAQGSLTPPGTPAPSQRSLQEIWDKLEALSQAVEALTPLVQQALPAAPGMVTVQGGTLVSGNSLNGTVVGTFQIGKYEVRWDEWQEVRNWALSNGYVDFTTGNGSAADHPVRDVSWYDVVKFCNARSEREALAPVYFNLGTVYRTGNFSALFIDSAANGYRLPKEAEWEWAARGGVLSRGFPYSGSGILTYVGWYGDNSGGAAVDIYGGLGTWPVGQKAANELGIYDMSGNVWEWCVDVGSVFPFRRIRGGSWNYNADDATVANQDSWGPDLRRSFIGFRLARNAAQ